MEFLKSFFKKDIEHDSVLEEPDTQPETIEACLELPYTSDSDIVEQRKKITIGTITKIEPEWNTKINQHGVVDYTQSVGEITTDLGQSYVFAYSHVHFPKENIQIGQEVAFKAICGKKGYRAENITLPDDRRFADSADVSEKSLIGYFSKIDTEWETRLNQHGVIDLTRSSGEITNDSGDIFVFAYSHVHFSKEDIRCGFYVVFEPVYGKKGNRAENINKVTDDNTTPCKHDDKQRSEEIEPLKEDDNHSPNGDINGFISKIDTDWKSKRDTKGRMDYSKLSGEITSEADGKFDFSYNSVKFAKTEIQYGLFVTFEPIFSKRGNRAIRVNKLQVQYGYLDSYDEKKGFGYLSSGTESIPFNKIRLRNDFEPFFDTIYKYDIAYLPGATPCSDNIDICEFNSDNLTVGQCGAGSIFRINASKNFLLVEILPQFSALVFFSNQWFSFVKPKVGDRVVIQINSVSEEDGKKRVKGTIQKIFDNAGKSIKADKTAVNIFRVDNLDWGLQMNTIVDIANRVNVSIDVKLNILKLITSRIELFKAINPEHWDKLVSDCKAIMDAQLYSNNYQEAYEILMNLSVYDISVLEKLNHFPSEFVKNLRVANLNTYEESFDDNDLDYLVFSRKYGCSIKDAQTFLDSSHKQIWDGKFEMIRDSLNIKPALVIPEEEQ